MTIVTRFTSRNKLDKQERWRDEDPCRSKRDSLLGYCTRVQCN